MKLFVKKADCVFSHICIEIMNLLLKKAGCLFTKRALPAIFN